MRIFFRRILIFVLVVALFFTNINISVAASGIGKESFYQMKNEQEDTRQRILQRKVRRVRQPFLKKQRKKRKNQSKEPRSSIMKQKKRVQSRNRKVQEHRINLSNNRRN